MLKRADFIPGDLVWFPCSTTNKPLLGLCLEENFPTYSVLVGDKVVEVMQGVWFEDEETCKQHCHQVQLEKLEKMAKALQEFMSVTCRVIIERGNMTLTFAKDKDK